MKLEATYMIAEWARHATYGINAQLAGIPRLPGVSLPPDVTVLDEYTDPDAALEQAPKSAANLPAVLVSAYHSPLEQSVPANQPFPPDGQVELALRYVARNSNTPEGVRDEGITLRAIWRCLPLLWKVDAGETFRQSIVTLTGVQLQQFLSMRELTLDKTTQGPSITGAVLLSVRCRDLHAGAS